MAEQLQMVWPEDRMADPPEWTVPDGYLLRTFRAGDEAAYLDLMHKAGFDYWTRENLDGVVKNAGPEGVFFVEHVDSSRIVATAMGWCRPHERFPEGHEMGWVAAMPAHRGRGLGRVVVAASTRAMLEHGARTIYLLTDDWRLPALRIYLEVGYVPFCREPEVEQRWSELFVKLGIPGKTIGT